VNPRASLSASPADRLWCRHFTVVFPALSRSDRQAANFSPETLFTYLWINFEVPLNEIISSVPSNNICKSSRADAEGFLGFAAVLQTEF